MTMTDNASRHMDRMYRHQRHIYDLTRRHYLLGRMTLINDLVPPHGGTVLEIGCGTGWNLIQLARQYPNAQLYGFDVSSVMLDTAGRKIAKAGLHERITLKTGDATTFDGRQIFGIRTFDRVVASYVLSMIPDWTAVMARAVEHLAPGGSFHIVDFGPAGGLPATIRVGLHRWLANFDVSPRTTLETEVASLARHHHLAPFYTELYRGYAQYTALTRR